MAAVDIDTARAAKEHLVAAVADEPKVNGVGLTPVGADRWALKVNLLEPGTRTKIPKSIKGVDVKVEVTGRARRQALA